MNDIINNPKHYIGEVEPIELILAQKLNYCEGNIVKYICRWKTKNGMKDLLKVKEYIDKYIEINESK